MVRPEESPQRPTLLS
uniref:Uncharacterized protein n=1 Tax=Timema poppense TaxID=170557 RepID=A0A7R9HE32_TIMPO|nr:unnamed protein product [Timema poppensis]